MAANYERIDEISLLAGADFTGTGATTDGAGEYHFGIINPNPIAAGSYTPAQVPGIWYGSSAAAPAIPAGNVILNTTAGGDCQVVITGKALIGQPVTCARAGRVLILVGTGGITAGAKVMSDATSKAVAWTSGNHILGTAIETGAAGDIVSILFQPRGVS